MDGRAGKDQGERKEVERGKLDEQRLGCLGIDAPDCSRKASGAEGRARRSRAVSGLNLPLMAAEVCCSVYVQPALCCLHFTDVIIYYISELHSHYSETLLQILQESRAVARKPRNAALVLFGLKAKKFTANASCHVTCGQGSETTTYLQFPTLIYLFTMTLVWDSR